MSLLPLLFTACTWAPTPCKAPQPTGHDPIIQDGYLDVNTLQVLGGAGFLVHLLDLAVDDQAGRLHGVGSGGYWVFEADGTGFVDHIGGFLEAGTDTYDRVAVLDGGVVAVLDRSTGDTALDASGERFNGVRLLDVQDPQDITQIGAITLTDIASLVAHDGVLTVLRHSGILQTYDVTAPSAPALLAELTGLGAPRALTPPDPQGISLVADALDGLIVVDLSDPRTPEQLHTVPTQGGAIDVSRTVDQAFVALGSKGVETFSLATGEPASLGLTPVSGTATQVAAADGLVWVAVVDGVATLRQQGDGPATPHGFEATDRFSLCVESIPTRFGAAYGCAWSDLFVFQADGGVSAPQAVLSTESLRLAPGVETASVSVSNGGGAELLITQLDSWARDLDAKAPADPLAPGATATLTLDFPGGFDRDLTVCMASTDPGEGVQTLSVGTGDDVATLEVGEAAPDFSLPDLDGIWHTLSDYRGMPVVLVWFATW